MSDIIELEGGSSQSREATAAQIRSQQTSAAAAAAAAAPPAPPAGNKRFVSELQKAHEAAGGVAPVDRAAIEKDMAKAAEHLKFLLQAKNYEKCARQDSAEDFCRLKAPCCTAIDWIFIPAHCFALP